MELQRFVHDHFQEKYLFLTISHLFQGLNLMIFSVGIIIKSKIDIKGVIWTIKVRLK